MAMRCELSIDLGGTGPAESMWARAGGRQPQNYTRKAGTGHKGIGLKAQAGGGGRPQGTQSARFPRIFADRGYRPSARYSVQERERSQICENSSRS